METTKYIKRIVSSVSVSALSIIGSAGNALAGSDSNSVWSGLNIRDGLNDWVMKLEPGWQPAANWLIDHVFIIVVIGTLLLLWWHSFSEKEAKRGGSISGQAQHEKMSEIIAKNFGTAIVFSILILFFAGKCLM